MVKILPIGSYTIISSRDIPFNPKRGSIGPYTVISSVAIPYKGATTSSSQQTSHSAAVTTAHTVNGCVPVTLIGQGNSPNKVVGNAKITTLTQADQGYLKHFLAQHGKN